MSTHKNLHFFNKQGDSLKVKYDENLEIFQGDILFDENSTDTFKTYALYTLEQVPSFNFYSPGELGTNKFQLFNEYGIHFYGATTSSFRIDRLEPANNDPNFYSKWIYGHNFESIFFFSSSVIALIFEAKLYSKFSIERVSCSEASIPLWLMMSGIELP